MAEPLPAPAASCGLCGQPIVQPFEKRYGRELLAFCCAGCLHVFDLLSQLPGGSPPSFRDTDVYRACLAAGIVAPRAEIPAAAPVLDEGTGAEFALSVEGMWCSACAWVIERVLLGTPGVLEAPVRFSSDVVRVRYLPHRISPEQVIASIARLGYSARPLEEGAGARGERKALLLRLGLSAILSMYTMMFSLVLYGGFFADLGPEPIRAFSLLLWIVATPAVFFCGGPILRRAWSGVRAGVPSMDALVAAGVLSAYVYSVGAVLRGSLHLYFDTAATLVTVVLFGRFLELGAKERISRRVGELDELAHAKVRLLAGGEERWVPSLAVAAGDELVVREGETVGVDGALLTGSARLDESVLTGESKPVLRSRGDPLRAGARVIEGELRLRADRPGAESSLRRLAGEVEEALARKSRTELLADRVTGKLVPAVLALSLGCAAWLLFFGSSAEEAFLRALSVVVITCPCALGIATPLVKVAAVGRARDEGVLIRDPAALEVAPRLDAIVFDKTGTLTEGRFVLRELLLHGTTREEALRRLATAEARSDHYLAREILRASAAEGVRPGEAEWFEVEEGLGVRAGVGGVEVLVGNRRLLASREIGLPGQLETHAALREAAGATAVLAAWNGEARALLVFGDAIKPTAREAVARLRARGLEVWLLSGDSETTTAAVAGMLGIEEYRGGASPEEKVSFLKGLQSRGRRVAAVGDGVNDAAALAAADLGIGVAAEGSCAAWRAADVALLTGDPLKILHFQDLARFAMRVLRQNLFFAFLYNVLAIPLALAGALNPLIAAAAMMASSLTVVGNTARLRRGAAACSSGPIEEPSRAPLQVFPQG